MREARVDDVRCRQAPDPGAQRRPLLLQHVRDPRVGKLAVQDAFHERAAVIILDVPQPLHGVNRPDELSLGIGEGME